MNSEGVIELLKKVKPTSVKILTTGDGRDVIKRYCMQAHISYAQINTYQRIPLIIDLAGLQTLYTNDTHKTVILTATSSGILAQFMSQLSDDLTAMVLAQPIVVGAQRIADLASNLGFGEIHVAASPSDAAMCAKVNELTRLV
jgi:uroporphyrinogen-III synthase